jgi:hypothetical protein
LAHSGNSMDGLPAFLASATILKADWRLHPAVASLGDDVAATCRQPARPGCLTMLELTRRRDRPSIQDRALAPTFIRRCTSEHSNESIALPKLNVVLVMHLLGSASRRLLVNAVELCSADQLPAAVHHEHLVPHNAVRSQRRPSSYSNVRLSRCQTRRGARNLCTCGSSAIPARGIH